MKFLSPEQIAFIDRYLANQGVKYDDVRRELTDHIASALEWEYPDDYNFREAFKAYMVVHKRTLLRLAKGPQWWSAVLWQQFGRFLIQPWVLLVLLGTAMGSNYALDFQASMADDTFQLVKLLWTGMVLLQWALIRLLIGHQRQQAYLPLRLFWGIYFLIPAIPLCQHILELPFWMLHSTVVICVGHSLFVVHQAMAGILNKRQIA